MIPKVFIGIITADAKKYAEDLFYLHLKRLTYPNIEVMIVDNSKDMETTFRLTKYGYHVYHAERFEDMRKNLVHSRNILRDYFLKSDADYFFSLESDVLPERNDIEKLMERNQPIVSGIYCFPSGAPIAYDYSYFSDEMRQRIRTDVCREGRLLPVKITGVGLMLIKREVLEKIKFRYEQFASGTDDVWFCLDALNLGYKIYLDTSVKAEHYGNYCGYKEVIKFK